MPVEWKRDEGGKREQRINTQLKHKEENSRVWSGGTINQKYILKSVKMEAVIVSYSDPLVDIAISIYKVHTAHTSI